MKNYKNKINIKNNKGSFLIDIMVGLGISSMVILTAMTIYSTFEEDKIMTQNISDSLFNVSMSASKISSIAKNAGYGINNSGILGCQVNAFRTDLNDFNFILSPVLIDSSDPQRHTLRFISGDSKKFFTNGSLIQQKVASQESLRIDTRFGFELGDLIIVGQPNVNCSLFQISGLPGTVGNTNQILLNNTPFINSETNTLENIRYHKIGGLGVNYNTNASVMNIGKNPTIIDYSINNQNQLVETNFLLNRTNIISNNIIGLQAIYGLDTNADGSVDTWQQVVNNNEIQNILGIRMALLTRTNLQAKKENGVCNVTVNNEINWLNGTFDVQNIPDWQCYRYRTIQTTIPLKNMLWK